nr:PREDICTED: LOW QUALITY PROTEIN: uncharacterized protein KIAA1211-like [Anolis carolinensis]|eukprot:XP_008122479.1 PREDICTED: LOW QUALITY PROTEIN: uncharacterized protein KIAA1211-like [Anolis carolinensis]
MAAKPMDPTEPPDVEDAGEEFSRKKKSRFQSFKDFFAKKKKARAGPASLGEAKMKPSQSSSDLAATDSGPGSVHLPTEPTISKGKMGNKALSHDSVFICESLPDVADKTASEEGLPGLQLRLQSNLRPGSPALVIPGKRADAAGAMSEDDGLPRSPPEISTLHDILACSTSEPSNPFQRQSSLSLDSEDGQVASESASRPLSPAVLGNPVLPTGLFVPADFNSPATPSSCLDTSAARHKMAVNPRRQKVFANKTLFMERLEKEEGSFGTAEGEPSPPEPPEGVERQDWKGLSAQDAKTPSWTNNVLPMTRVADALRYSWNAGPGADGDWRLALETDKETAVQVDFRNEEKEDMEEERVRRTDGLKHHEGAESLPLEAEAATLGDLPFLVMSGDVPGRDHYQPLSSCSQLEDQDSRSGIDTKYGEKAGDRTWNGSWSPVSDSAEFVPSPVSESLSEAEEISTFEDVPVVKEEARESVEETELFGGHTQPDDAEVEEPPLFPSADPCTSPLRKSPGRQEENTSQRSLNRPSFPLEAAEMPPQSIIALDNDAIEPTGKVKIGEESKNTDIDVEMQAKCVSAKPVRFTIAPAWQRSLSGGSSSTDSVCLASSPSSPPIKPELFEGTPRADSALPGCLFRLERSKSITNPATERPNKASRGQESPFGVRLRRTSSLLKYQAEQQRQEAPKQAPSSASSGAASALVKEEPKAPVSETPPPKRTTGSAKGLAAKSIFKEEKKSLKAKAEEGTTKQQMAELQSKARPHLWKRRRLNRHGFRWQNSNGGFQGLPLVQGQKRGEKTLAKAEQAEEEKHTGLSPQEKHLNLPVLKNSIPLHVLETKAQPKRTTSAPKAKPIRASSREAHPTEKEPRPLPSLPLSSCGSPSEPPWLSLAKQKAKAWSEMPQIVQ